MTFYVYLIISTNRKINVTYVGYTNNLVKRLKLHNAGKGAKFTRGSKWKLLYFKKCNNKKISMKEEFRLKKNYKFRNYIKSQYYLRKNND